MSTPHNEAPVGAFAKTVLMPGDPKRSEHIAKTFLENPNLVNDVRGVHGYTGTWKGVPVSIMASGMGIPSISIYSWELFTGYDVDNIIRIGSAGGLQDDINLLDVVAGQAACTNSNYVNSFGIDGTFAPIADFTLLSAAVEAAKENNINLKVGNIVSGDNFYYAFDNAKNNDKWKQMGALALEMEAAGLYTNAAYFHKRALCLCTISDHLYKEGMLTHEERQTSMNQMVTIALDTAVKMAGK